MFVSTNALIAWGAEFDRWSLVAQSSSGYIAIVAMIVGLVVGAGALLIVNQLRGRELKAKADAFLSQAKSTADNLVRTAEVDAKEAALHQKQQLGARSQQAPRASPQEGGNA